MGEGWVGVRFVQGAIEDAPDAVGIAEDVMVPEAQDSISLGFDDRGAGGIGLVVMLPAVDFDPPAWRGD
jgi:hypothetical protein